jgi:hypothetical protein
VVTTETRARVHVVLGRLIVALQYADRSNLTSRLTPALPAGTASALDTIARYIPSIGRTAWLREASTLLSGAYSAIAADREHDAQLKSAAADALLTAFFNSAGQRT